MEYKGWDAWRVFQKALGRRVLAANVIAYVYQGQKSLATGQLELLFTDNLMMRLKGTNGGDLLLVHDDAWVDPYKEPLDEVAINDISQYGKYSRVNVTGIAPFNELIEQRLTAVYPLVSQFELLAGIRFIFGGVYMNFITDADETAILWGKSSSILMEFGYRILEEES